MVSLAGTLGEKDGIGLMWYLKRLLCDVVFVCVCLMCCCLLSCCFNFCSFFYRYVNVEDLVSLKVCFFFLFIKIMMLSLLSYFFIILFSC